MLIMFGSHSCSAWLGVPCHTRVYMYKVMHVVMVTVGLFNPKYHAK